MNRITILIASNDETIIDSIANILDKEQFRPVYSNKASEALLKILDVNLDLLILDIDLPGMSVLEILPIIKKVNQDMPLVVISSDDSFKTGQEIARLGRSLYLMKPIAIDKLQTFLNYIKPTLSTVK